LTWCLSTTHTAFLKFIYHRGDEAKTGSFNIRMLRKKGQPEHEGLGSVRGIHDKVDVMFRLIAHINDPSLASDEACFWRSLPSAFMAQLRDTTPEGMASWDRDFILRHVDLAMESTATILATARYPSTTIADLKSQLADVWSKVSFHELHRRHDQHQLIRMNERITHYQQRPIGVAARAGRHGESRGTGPPGRGRGRGRDNSWMPGVATVSASVDQSPKMAGEAPGRVCVNDLAHNLLKGAPCSKHAAGECRFPHLTSYATQDKEELTRQCKSVLTRNPALLARLVTAIAAMWLWVRVARGC